MKLPFDPNDPGVHRWLVELNVAVDDIRCAVEDRLRKRRKRDLGHRQHVALIGGGFDKIDHLLGRKAPPPAPEQPASTHH